ncbi:MAG: peptidylprolyl isomerase, partial [Nitrosarchaeum sp.]
MLIAFLLLLVVVPAYAAPLSDRTGLVNKLDVKTDGYVFQIETVANYDIESYEFDKDQKRLTLHIYSGIEKNLGELYLPQTLLSGNFTFYLNGQEFFPKVKQNSDISFITLNFTGSGDNKIEIIGTDYMRGMRSSPVKTELPAETPQDKGGGCLIATAAYG